MKKLFTFLIIFLVINITFLAAQRGEWSGERSGQNGPPKITVTGKIVDSNNNAPLEFATITFFSKEIVASLAEM